MAEELFGGVGGGGIANIVAGSNITLSYSAGTYTINGETNSGATTFLAGIVNSGNTSNTTGVVNNQLVLVGGNNITLSENLNANSATVLISAPNYSNSFGASNLGNVSGTSGIASGSQVKFFFAGGNNITLSQSVNGASGTITIVGVTTSAQQTGISSIQASDTTYTSGKVIFTGAGAVTVSSGANQSVIINAPVQSVQPEGTVAFGVSDGGHTLGTTGMASGTGPQLVFVGGTNITLSQSLDAGASSGTITIIGAAGGAGGGAQMTVDGNKTSGPGGYILISSGTATLAGGNNVTLSQDGNAVTIIAAGASGSQSAQTGISAIADGASSSVTAGTVQFVNSNGMSFGYNSVSMTGSYTVPVSSNGILDIGAATNAGTASSRFAAHDHVHRGVFGVNAHGIASTFVGSVDLSAGNLIALSTGGASNAGTIAIHNALASTSYVANVSNVSSVGSLSSKFALADHAHIGVAGLNVSGTASTFVGNVMISVGNNLTMSTGGNSSAGTVELFNLLSSSSYAANVSNVSSAGSRSSNYALVDHAHIGVAGIVGSGTASTFVGNVVLSAGSNITLVTSGNSSAGTLQIIGAAGAGGGIAASLSGNNTSGTMTVVSSGTLYLAGGNNITLSQNGNSVTISAPSGGGAGVSSLGNTAGTTGTVDYQLVFVGGSNVSLSQSIDGSSGTVTINAAAGAALSTVSYVANVSNVSSVGSKTGSYAIADHAHIGVGGVVASGIASTFVGNVVISGGNNVTLSTAGNSSAGTIAIHGGAGAALGMTNTGNTAGTVFTTGTGTVYFQGTNNITVSNSSNGSSQTLWISGPTGGGAGMGDSVGTSGTSGSVGKELYFYGGANISLSQSVNGSSGSLWIVGGAGAGGGATVNGSTGNVSFAAGNNMSLSTNGSTLTYINVLSSSAIAQPVSNVSSAGTLASRYALADHAHAGLAGVNFSGTASTFVGSLMVSAGNNMTMSTGGNATAGSIALHNLLSSSALAANVSNVSSAGSKTANFALVDHAHLGVAGIVPNATASSFVGYLNLSAGNNISLASGGNSSAGSLQVINILSSSGYAANVSNVSSAGSKTANFALADHAHVGVAGLNVSGTATTWVGNVMLSVTNLTLVTGGNSSAGSIGISGAAEHSNAIGMSNLSNTAGTTGVVSAQAWRYVFAGGNSITLSQSIDGSSGTLTINGPNGMVAGMLESGNTTASTFLASNRLVLVGGNNITLSGSSNGGSGTVVISGPPQGTLSQWMPRGLGASSFQQIGQSSLAVFPVHLEGFVSVSRADVFVSNSVSTSSNSSYQGTLSLGLAIYTRNVSTLSLASSGSVSYTWNGTGSTSSGSLVGMRNISIPVAAVMTPGVYYMGILSQTASSGNNWMTLSNLALQAFPNAFSGPFGGATNASNQFIPGLGIFSAQTAALPATVAFGDLLASSASTARPIVNFMNYTA